MSRLVYDCAECGTLHSVVYTRSAGERSMRPYVVCSSTAKLDPKRIKREEDFISKIASRVGEGGRP